MEKNVIEFIKTRIGVDTSNESMIFEDLGIDGLDAESFMIEFSNHFNVDMTEFKPELYYFSEYELGNIFLSMYRSIFNRRALKKRAFSLTHLAEVAERKKWFDPPF